jgi:N-acetyl-anhydromuramyl-L-alanine amidase AmpD
MTTYDTDRWPFVMAKYFTHIPLARETRYVRVIVIHDMEAPEKGDTAESISNYFAQMPDDRQASAHICVDNNSIVQCVPDNSVAYGAPGCNNDGIQIELAGYGYQTRAQWLDVFGQSMLELAAEAVAQYCVKYAIPATHLTDVQLSHGEKGIVGHAQVSNVYHKSTHTDPGPNFPWDNFMLRVTRHLAARRQKLGITT